MSSQSTNVPEDRSDTISRSSSDREKAIAPKAVLEGAQVVTSKGNIITKDGNLVSTLESDASLSTNIFQDPEIRDYYVKLYEEAKYECRHVFDADLTWTEEEEKAIIRKLDWRGMYRYELPWDDKGLTVLVIVCLWACIMFFSLQLDRGNIQQAVSGTLLQDLKLSTNGRWRSEYHPFLDHY